MVGSILLPILPIKNNFLKSANSADFFFDILLQNAKSSDIIIIYNILMKEIVMVPNPINYQIFPSVFPADTETEVTIVPTEKAFLFFEDKEYTLTVIPVNGDEIQYKAPTLHDTFTVKAKDGVIRFNYTFKDEQEHKIILKLEEVKLQIFTVYSLLPDLYELRPLKGDLHAHSYRSDGKRDPAALAGHFREQGFEFFALTDHNRYYPGGEIDETYADVKLGVLRVPGEETHTPGSVVHIVHVGGNASVDEIYVNESEKYEKGVALCLERVPADVPEQYRERYARAMWATEEIHKVGGLAIFPHPYWRPGASMAYNVRDEFAKILLKSGMFDAYELVGGMGQDGVNRSIALYNDLRAEGLSIAVVGSSDVHKLINNEEFPHHYTICFAKENESGAILDAIKSHNSVAVEENGIGYEIDYRCYGSLRLVSYAQFLLRYFYPQLIRICAGEGIAMRAYAIGDAPASLIELQVEQSERFRLRFFGKLAPSLPSPEVIEFENRWREVHLKSPITKGSTLDSDKVTRQI